MYISARGKYALSLMMDLAEHDDGGPVKLKDVADRQEISLKFLEQISLILKKGGLINSYRGILGGYKIKYEPQKYTVGMILRITELNVFDYKERYDLTENTENCDYVAEYICKQLSDALNETVDNITLQDLIDWQAKRKDLYII